MLNKEEINAVIVDCVNNSRKAQEKLFKLFYGKMLYVCLRYTSDRDTAQELVQEGFIKVFEKLRTFDKIGSLEAWIRRIMVNTSIDFLRKNKNVTFYELNENITRDLTETDDDFELEIQDDANFALSCINELSPAYKAVFNLFYVEDLTHKEIAEELGISEGTSKSNLAKAKIRMKQIYEQKKLNE